MFCDTRKGQQSNKLTPREQIWSTTPLSVRVAAGRSVAALSRQLAAGVCGAREQSRGFRQFPAPMQAALGRFEGQERLFDSKVWRLLSIIHDRLFLKKVKHFAFGRVLLLRAAWRRGRLGCFRVKRRIMTDN